MAKMKNSKGELLTGAAEIVGGALGTIAGTVDRLKADHPHPVDEAKEVLDAGQQKIAQVAADMSNRATAVIKATKTVITELRKPSTRTRKRAAQIRGRGRKIVKQAKRVARKTVKRGKKVVARARKSAARSRAAARRR